MNKLRLQLSLVTKRSFAGDITRGGGSFGRKERAQEEQYYWKKEQEELKKLRDTLLAKKNELSKLDKEVKEKESALEKKKK